MELKVYLTSMIGCEEIPHAQYSIIEDHGDPQGCIHIVPNKEKGEIVLDESGMKDMIDVLQMMLKRFGYE